MVTKITEFHQKLKDSLTTIRKPIDSSKREVKIEEKEGEEIELKDEIPQKYLGKGEY